jgi:DNA-binding winged helix-turn-helix (wHTH) protein/tetratricopeptide (TPR) repeat protein/TolB-like protein
MVLRFAGFELDRQRVELRGPGGEAIKLRPKTFDLLTLFATNPGRTLSKRELMATIWPNVHVGEDSLFQCVREIRTALGDNRRQLLKLVTGHGYRFDVEVTSEPAGAAVSAPAEGAEPVASAATAAATELAKSPWSPFGLRAMLAAVAGLGAIVGLAVAAPMFGPGLLFPRTPPAIAVMPIAGAGHDNEVAAMAAGVTERLIDGLARIDNFRVVAPPLAAAASSAKPVSATSAPADFVVTGELRKDEHAWTLQARLIRTASNEVQSATSLSVDIKGTDPQVQQSRLAAGIGHPLAVRINALLNADTRSAAAANGSPPAGAKVAIEQATASIMKTTRERFAAAQTMLEKALANDADNVDLQVALAALQLRGIQMVWYSPADSVAAEHNARSILERALRAKPSYIPALEAYCRFLNATNQFIESLVACARTLAFDPWDGMALYHIGLAHIQLGRFEDALATFRQADSFDTPPVSRWTWLLGVGWSQMLLGRDEEALPWLQRSIAITPASGRPLMALAAAYQRSGRPNEAKTAMAKALELRPGSTALNVPLPKRNASPAFLEASEHILRAMIEAGLPER